MTVDGTSGATTPSVAVTGWAVRTAFGHTVDELVRRLEAGERAARANARFDARSYACTLAAAIDGSPARSPHDRILRRAGRFGYHAAIEALAMSGAAGGVGLGLFSGVGGLRAHWNELMPALAGQRDDLAESWQRGFRRIHPYWMLQHLSNNTHALLSRDVDARGEGVTFGGGNAGAQALASAARALGDHAVDAALVVAYDSLIEPETVVEMAARGALATCPLDDWRAPYGRDANGAIPGEAAAALVLMRGDDAGARALAYVAAHESADGRPGTPAMETLGATAAVLARGDEGLIDGACLGVPALDDGERRCIAEFVDEGAYLVGLQAGLGQIGAAAPLVQTAVLGHALRAGRTSAIPGLVEPRPGPLMPLGAARTIDTRAALGLCAGAPGLAGVVRVSVER